MSQERLKLAIGRLEHALARAESNGDTIVQTLKSRLIEETAAPDESYKAGARIFPALVPTDPSMAGVAENVEAWKVLKQWTKPFLTGFSDQDPVSKGGEQIFQKLVPGATGQPHAILKGGGHFLQEDVHAELSEMLIALCARL